MLSAYYNHFRAFENTLVTKFYGLHCVKLTGPIQRKVENAFAYDYQFFDMKAILFLIANEAKILSS